MNVAQYLSKFCITNKLFTLYHYIGGMTVRLIDEINNNKELRLITMRHEQGAGFAASAHARIENKPIISLATSGPGAINLLGPVADCFFDHIPAIFITGQVKTTELNSCAGVRQLGFQETDIVSMAKPVTKAAFLLESAKDFPKILADAYNIAMTAPYGPVLIDIPMDLQIEDCQLSADQTLKIDPSTHTLPSKLIEIEQFKRDLERAKKPLILLGHGVRLAKAVDNCVKFIETHKIPYVYSLHGSDCALAQYNFGLIGSYGNRYGNLALAEADFILVLGARLDIRQTGANIDFFEQGKVIYQVDVNTKCFNLRTNKVNGIPSDVNNFMEKILNTSLQLQDLSSWHKKLETYKNSYPTDEEIKLEDNSIHPHKLLKKTFKVFKQSAGYALDVGKNQMYAAQAVAVNKGQRVITSGGFGAMGFALPASIGMAMATNKEVICVSGDGGLQINIQELETIKYYNLNIKIIVLQNQSLGMVQQFQEEYCDSRLVGTRLGYSSPNMKNIAQAYGIESKQIKTQEEVDSALSWLKATTGPCLLECIIPYTTKLIPKLSYGNDLDNMYPPISKT